jgi:capsular polysaccharide biosynthesis protein
MPVIGRRTRSALIGLRESVRGAIPSILRQRFPPEPGLVFEAKCVQRARDIAATHSCTTEFFEEVSSRERQSPRIALPGRLSCFEAHRTTQSDPLFVMTLRNARVTGRFPAVISRAGALFADVSRVHSEPIHSHPIYSRFRLPRVQRLAGRTLLLTAAWGGSYYHWMIDQLPRLALLPRAGIELRSFDHILLPDLAGQFVEETLRHWPELQGKFTALDDAYQAECEELVCPSLPHRIGEADAWGPAWVGDRIRGPKRPELGERRFLLSRAGAPRRRLANEDELYESLLAARGFERVMLERYTVREQAELLSQASLIVAPHGAALTNLIFAPRRCTIIELVPIDYPATCFWHLADELGLEYRYVLARSAPQRTGGQHADFAVDVGLVRECLAG